MGSCYQLYLTHWSLDFEPGLNLQPGTIPSNWIFIIPVTIKFSFEGCGIGLYFDCKNPLHTIICLSLNSFFWCFWLRTYSIKIFLSAINLVGSTTDLPSSFSRTAFCIPQAEFLDKGELSILIRHCPYQTISSLLIFCKLSTESFIPRG